MHQPQSPTLKELRHHGTKSFPFAAYKTCFASKGTMVKHHWHEEIEMIYFFEGDFRLEINMEPFYIRSECIYFINPGELHSIVIENNNSSEEEAIVFSSDILSFECYDAVQVRLIQPIQHGTMIFPRCLMPDQPAFIPVRDSFLDIMNIYERSGEKSTLFDPVTNQLYIKSSLLRIFALLSDHRLFLRSEKNDDKRVEEIKKVITYIMENYKEKIYIHDLADLVSMNEQYFCRFFKKAIGRSPIAYVNDYRIKQAVRLLKETDLPIMEICLECGFNNLGNFLKEFRKYTNTTPLKYRRNLSCKNTELL